VDADIVTVVGRGMEVALKRCQAGFKLTKDVLESEVASI